jgi:hypothetical protein
MNTPTPGRPPRRPSGAAKPETGAYTSNNPTVAARIPRALHARLLAEAAARGVPTGVLIREALEFRLGGLATRYDTGRAVGWREATTRYAVAIPCNGCGGDLVAEGPMRDAAAEFLQGDGWVHQECAASGEA